MLGNDTNSTSGSAAQIVVVTGPTAVGKTELSLRLAEQLNAEIINGDAMQCYQGLEIGTAKPTLVERGVVPHHLFDLWQVTEKATVAEYQRHGRDVANGIWSRGRTVVVVGGSPLYLRALCDELDIPPQDLTLRAELASRAEQEGGAVLHQELSALDPEAGAAIDPRNVRRVVRALEVVRLTGSFTARLPEPKPWRPTVWLGIDLPRSELDDRISMRAQSMWDNGLLQETVKLMERGLADGETARKAVGYEQAMAVLSGDMSRDQGIAETITATRRLARRQQRTLHRDDRITWLPAENQLEPAIDFVKNFNSTFGRTQSPAAD